MDPRHDRKVTYGKVPGKRRRMGSLHVGQGIRAKVLTVSAVSAVLHWVHEITQTPLKIYEIVKLLECWSDLDFGFGNLDFGLKNT